MAEKAKCRDCGEEIHHNARHWVERHVKLNGHNVHVSLVLDMDDDAWMIRVSHERSAETKEAIIYLANLVT